MPQEIEYFYLPIYDEASERNIFDRVYYKYAEPHYGDLNLNLPYGIKSQGIAED